MKIEHINHTATDTDKLPDIDAQIIEMAEQLRDLCEKSKRPFVLTVSPAGNEKFYAFWNIQGMNNVNEKGIDIGFMLGSINSLVMQLTQGGLCLKPNE
jgi:hypothetical protein